LTAANNMLANQLSSSIGTREMVRPRRPFIIRVSCISAKS